MIASKKVFKKITTKKIITWAQATYLRILIRVYLFFMNIAVAL